MKSRMAQWFRHGLVNRNHAVFGVQILLVTPFLFFKLKTFLFLKKRRHDFKTFFKIVKNSLIGIPMYTYVCTGVLRSL